MPFCETRGARIHFQVRGEGEPLLVLNGWSASGLIWPERWLEHLARSFRLVIVCNRGTGYSDAVSEQFTMVDLADDALAVLDDLGVSTAHVFGMSMGGMIAQTIVVEQPERVRGLVLCSTAPGGPEMVQASPEVMLRLITPAPGTSPDELVGGVWRRIVSPGFGEREPEVMDLLVAAVAARPTPVSVILLQWQAMSGFAVFDRLAGVRAPTLVLHGDVDPLIPFPNGVMIADRIPGARFEAYPGVGHLIPWEVMDRSAELIEEFLLGLASA